MRGREADNRGVEKGVKRVGGPTGPYCKRGERAGSPEQRVSARGTGVTREIEWGSDVILFLKFSPWPVIEIDYFGCFV